MTDKKKKKSVQFLLEEESTQTVLSISSKLFAYANSDNTTTTTVNPNKTENGQLGKVPAPTIEKYNNGCTNDNTAAPSRETPIPTTNAPLGSSCSSISNHDNNKQQPNAANSSSSSKITQTNQAMQLLRHMTKGTQSLSMFDNKQALWGYTRQKFYERAMLVVKSLTKLSELSSLANGKNDTFIPHPTVEGIRETEKYGNEKYDEEMTTANKNNDMEDGMTQGKIHLGIEIWSQLMKIKTACSIGCGPGNDIVGLVSLLQAVTNNNDAATTTASSASKKQNNISNNTTTNGNNKTKTAKERNYSLEK
eukprot:8767108-Ditylum_brightwellii.AAC.1